MRKGIGLAVFMALMVCFACSAYAEGRLNFMLINLTGQDITDVKICPTYYPQYQSENLIKTTLAPQHHIYIGPNYYGEQTFWTIAVKWANGHEQAFPKLRLTRYNTYTIYSTPHGIKIRQSYDPQYANYSFPLEVPTYMGAKEEVKVKATEPKKLDSLPSLPVDMTVVPGKAPAEPVKQAAEQAKPASDQAGQGVEQAKETMQTPKAKLAFTDKDSIPDKARAIKTSVEVARNGEKFTVNPNESFMTGDEIRLNFTTNKDGHAYWVKKKGDNEYHLIFPVGKTEAGAKVNANEVYTASGKEPLRFDEKSTETLYAILLPDDVTELNEAMELQEAGKTVEASRLIAEFVKNHQQKKSANPVVLEEEDEEDINMQSQLADGEFIGEYELEAK